MSDFMNAAKEFASEAIEKASDKAEIGKYKAKIVGKKTDIDKIQRRMGLYIYLTYSESEDDADTMDPKLRDMCKQIDAIYDEIALLENKIDKIKDAE